MATVHPAPYEIPLEQTTTPPTSNDKGIDKPALASIILAHASVDMQTISLVTLLPSLLAAFNLNYASAATADDAERELAEFDKKWGEKYPMIARSWRTVWANVIPFFKFPP